MPQRYLFPPVFMPLDEAQAYFNMTAGESHAHFFDFNIGPFCRLVHDEGLFLTLPGAAKFSVAFARDAAGTR